MSTLVTGAGAAVPGAAIPNSFFADLGVDDEWIATRTGVRERYKLSPGALLADLAAQAAEIALQDAETTGAEIDFVIVATSTPDRPSPGLAPRIAHLIGASNAGAVDVNGACTGFLYALDYAVAKVEQGSADRILVIGADAMSRITDAADKNTAVLFGDGAGAVVVSATSGASCDRCDPLFTFGSAGDNDQSLHVSPDTGYVLMDGAEVYMAAVEAMSDELENVLNVHASSPDDIAQLVCHQANGRIMAAVARRVGWPIDKALAYIDRFGNTSAASIPIALATGQHEERFTKGDRLALAAFGAGFSWGAGLVTWKKCPHHVSSTHRKVPDDQL